MSPAYLHIPATCEVPGPWEQLGEYLLARWMNKWIEVLVLCTDHRVHP